MPNAQKLKILKPKHEPSGLLVLPYNPVLKGTTLHPQNEEDHDAAGWNVAVSGSGCRPPDA